MDILQFKTTKAAGAHGFRPNAPPGKPARCVPNMGMHYVKDFRVESGKRIPNLLLLFNKKGDLLGFEVESIARQPTPPWEHEAKGHRGMEFEHWAMHVYIRDPHGACAN